MATKADEKTARLALNPDGEEAERFFKER